MEKVFSFRREEKKEIKKRMVWTVKSQNGDELEVSEHTTRSKAILAFYRSHPNGVLCVTIPNEKGIDTVLILGKVKDLWILKTIDGTILTKKSSLANAVNALSYKYLSGVNEFQISISDNKGEG